MSYFKRTGTGINDVEWDRTLDIDNPEAKSSVELSSSANDSGANLKLTGSFTEGTATTSKVQIIGIDAPKSDDAAANKKYVDDIGVAKLDKSGGVMTGDINMNENAVKNVKAPVDNGDAANKKYVDDAVKGAAPAGDYLDKSGGTMTGNINMGDNQITNVNTMTASNIIVKGTGDAQASIKVTGDASRSEIDLNDASDNPVVVKGVDTPAENTDAANKSYVDAVDAKVTQNTADITGVKNTVNGITGGSTKLPYVPFNATTSSAAISGEAEQNSLRFGSNKNHVDLTVNSALTTPVIALSGTNDENGVQLKGIAAPTDSTDAVNKDYADAILKPETVNKVFQLKRQSEDIVIFSEFYSNDKPVNANFPISIKQGVSLIRGQIVPASESPSVTYLSLSLIDETNGYELSTVLTSAKVINPTTGSTPFNFVMLVNSYDNYAANSLQLHANYMTPFALTKTEPYFTIVIDDVKHLY